MMIDLILFSFCLALFGAGFWCGGKFGSWAKLFESIKATIKQTLA